ncbi:hypothetical protein VaNZ11_013435 [Volvox africanus]|uniref:GTPase Der n=1 Tax=Volvox africanus TaxID=51714 RepID=A0ABQ5SHF3_9CHLO|nr:hypothetical protein VaNZ11_013435 [Volvox africanus]
MHGRTTCVIRLLSQSVGITMLEAPFKQAARGVRRAAGAREHEIQQRVDNDLLPKVALVGRPNVGKSALFNRLLRRRAALVYDTPNSHVTRDYQEGRAQLGDLVFRAADTSGLEPRGGSNRGSINARATVITGALLRQCHLALLVLDAKDGVLPADEEVAKWLASHVPRDQVLVVANKAEGAKAREEMPQTVYDCYRLGFGEPVAVSATTGDGLADLYTALQPHIDALTEQLAAKAEADGNAAAEAASGSGSPSGSPRGTGVVAAVADDGRETSTLPQDGSAEGAESRRVRLSLRGPRRRLLFRRRQGADTATATEAAEDNGSTVAGDGVSIAGCDSGASGGVLKLAIMGLPNAGKSTLLNRLVGEERALTGPEPGLTRDAVRASWMYGNQPVELIDTAGWIGVGRTASYDDVGGEVASMSRQATLRSLAQVHVALLVVDVERALRSNRVLARRELSLASHVIREGKALILVANKMDVLTQQQRALYRKSLREHLSQRFLEAGQLPVVEVSARDGLGLDAIMPVVEEAYQAWNKRIGTARLNNFIAKLSARTAGGGGTEASLRRIRYMTQIKSRPPTFVAFLRGTASRPVSGDFSSFLAHQIRDVLGFPGVPLRIWFRYRDRVAERQHRMVSIRSRRGQLPRGCGLDSGGGSGRGNNDGRGSIMADALRRAEELRREGGDDKNESADNRDVVGVGSDVVGRSIRQGGTASSDTTAISEDGDHGNEVTADKMTGQHGPARYMPPRLRRPRSTAAAAGSELNIRSNAKSHSDGGGQKADGTASDFPIPDGDGSSEVMAAVVRSKAHQAWPKVPVPRGTAVPHSSNNSRGSARTTRLQVLDPYGDEVDGDAARDGWHLDEVPPPGRDVLTVPQSLNQTPSHSSNHPGFRSTRQERGRGEGVAAPSDSEGVQERIPDELPAVMRVADRVGTAVRLDRPIRTGTTASKGTALGVGGGMVTAESGTRTHGSGLDSGSTAADKGSSTRTLTRAELMRMMLFSRKPSAPLVPVQGTRRSRRPQK